MPAASALRIGLTGGIGSGKSTAAARLAALGAVIVDTDAIARRLTGPGGAAMPAMAAAFGPGVVAADGALDRPAMRQIAFGSTDAKRRLEAVMHPLIGREAMAEADAAAGAPVVFDVPLLAESAHWRGRVHRVLVIDCTEPTQAARVALRPGWTHDAAMQVIAQQAGRPARRAVADAVIFNDGIDPAQLHDEIDCLWRRWLATPV